jgi:ElaB/YqjD/DUF883 family membrane-anchored ribosome-binding protein
LYQDALDFDAPNVALQGEDWRKSCTAGDGRKEDRMKTATLPNVSWEDGRDSAVKVWNQARENGEDLVYRIGRYAKRNPWKALVVALGAGIVLGAAVTMGAKD